MATGFPVKANYATGDVLTAANMNDLSGTVNYLQYMTPRNPVLNSQFNVWQRGTSFTTVGGVAYTADRWVSRTGSAGGSLVTTRDTSVPTGFQYSGKFRRSTGNTDIGVLQVFQSFETVNSLPFAGKTVTLSFYAKAGANFSSVASSLGSLVSYGTGTDQIYYSYTGNVDNLQGNTLTTSWQRFTQTVAIPSTATELTVGFYYTPSGTAGADDSFYVTGVQLELGSSANSYMPNQPTYATELAACQRYYYQYVTGTSQPNIGLGVFYNSANFIGVLVPLPVTMRTAPTLVHTTGTNYYIIQRDSGNINMNSLLSRNATPYNLEIYQTSLSGSTGGYAAVLINGNAASSIAFNAEL